MNTEKVLADLIVLIKKAGEAVLFFYGKESLIKDKGDDSPLTRADLAANTILVKALRTKYPWPILSEEGVDDAERFGADMVWILDPLDGTKDFIQQTGDFTIMMALVKKQVNNKYRPILGIIHRPLADTSYYASRGGGTWLKKGKNGALRLQVSGVKNYHNMTMLSSRNHRTDMEKAVAKSLGIGKIATFGSSLKVCLIAEQRGHFNFNPSPHTWEWDVCASDIIIHEAGGKFSDIKGDLIYYNKKNPRNKNGYLACTDIIQNDILKIINKIKKQED